MAFVNFVSSMNTHISDEEKKTIVVNRLVKVGRQRKEKYL